MTAQCNGKKGAFAVLEGLLIQTRVRGGYPGLHSIGKARDDLQTFIDAYRAVRVAVLAGYDAAVTLPAVDIADEALAKLTGEPVDYRPIA